MAVVPIVKYPHRKLTQKCVPAVGFGEETKEIIKDLIDTLEAAKNPEGAGLSAPQIGALKRICVVKKFLSKKENGDKEYKNIVLVNPVITKVSKQTSIDWEGCLSIDDTYGQVERPQKVRLTSYDDKGNIIKVDASGFLARVIQHEIDHLNGVLFTSKVIGKTLTEKELDSMYSK